MITSLECEGSERAAQRRGVRLTVEDGGVWHGDLLGERLKKGDPSQPLGVIFGAWSCKVCQSLFGALWFGLLF